MLPAQSQMISPRPATPAARNSLYRVDLTGGPYDGYSGPWALIPPPRLRPPVLDSAGAEQRVAEYELACSWIAAIEPPVVLLRYRFAGYSSSQLQPGGRWFRRCGAWLRGLFGARASVAE